MNFKTIALAGIALSIATPAMAHHSFAMFDRDKNVTMTGIVKAGYSPHEQYSSDSRLQGPWSDLYALGGTLYRAVTGRPPDEATSIHRVPPHRLDRDPCPGIHDAPRHDLSQHRDRRTD